MCTQVAVVSVLVVHWSILVGLHVTVIITLEIPSRDLASFSHKWCFP